jgi:hypothetical protein
VGGAQHQQIPLPPPALGLQLLPRVEQKSLAALVRWQPAVAAGPDPPQLQVGAVALSKQQGAALQRCGGQQHPLENDQAMPT